MPESAGATLGSIIAVALQHYQAALSGYARANLQAASNHRINTPGDNPSGMFTVDSLQTHMDALNTAIGNATEAGSLVSTALTAASAYRESAQQWRLPLCCHAKPSDLVRNHGDFRFPHGRRISRYY